LFHPSCPVLAGYPVLDILSQPPWLFHPGSPVLAVLSLLSFSGVLVLCFLSWIYCLNCVLSLSCPGWLLRPDCPISAVL
jgi:hypothetical protein